MMMMLSSIPRVDPQFNFKTHTVSHTMALVTPAEDRLLDDAWDMLLAASQRFVGDPILMEQYREWADLHMDQLVPTDPATTAYHLIRLSHAITRRVALLYDVESDTYNAMGDIMVWFMQMMAAALFLAGLIELIARWVARRRQRPAHVPAPLPAAPAVHVVRFGPPPYRPSERRALRPRDDSGGGRRGTKPMGELIDLAARVLFTGTNIVSIDPMHGTFNIASPALDMDLLAALHESAARAFV